MAAFNVSSIEILEIPDFGAVPHKTPRVIDSMTLAHSLGIRNNSLLYFIINRGDLYTLHVIPKKSGGKRIIHAPDKKLKYLQSKVLKKFFTNIDYPDHITAYVPGRTTRYSAEVHAGNPLLIVMDLKNFFPSTRRSWVRHMLREEFGYAHPVASLLADLVTVPIDTPKGVRHVVPQGAPTSGAVCNWVAHGRLDKPLLKLCEARGMNYTRYADDLAFSCATRLGRKETNEFIQEVRKLITDSGYRVNRKKLRVTRAGRQQRLLGMTINEKPNIMRVHYRRLRARIHGCHHRGFDAVAKEMGVESGEKLRSEIEGLIAYYTMINPDKANNLRKQLQGIPCNV